MEDCIYRGFYIKYPKEILYIENSVKRVLSRGSYTEDSICRKFYKEFCIEVSIKMVPYIEFCVENSTEFYIENST